MHLAPRLDIIGSALSDPSRTRMLCELMDGRAYTNKELASAAGVTPQTATAHLKHLADIGLTVSLKSGRCVYHRLAGPEVAQTLEAIAVLAPSDHLHRATQGKGARLDALVARSCYDHLAGRLGVAICAALQKKDLLQPEGLSFVPKPDELWGKLGVVFPEKPGRKPFARTCLDWTERKHHLAGPLATQLMSHAFEAHWLRRIRNGRGLEITTAGQHAFHTLLAI